MLRNGKLLRQPYDDSYTLASLNLSADLAVGHLTAVASYLYRSATFRPRTVGITVETTF